MSRRSVRALAVALAAAAALLLAGCDPIDTATGNASGSGGGATGETVSKPETGCSAAEGKAGALLPAVDDVFLDAKTNPCIPLAELADLVLELVPAGTDEATTANRAQFRTTVARVSDPLLKTAGRVLAADAVAKCGYETDRLAIRFYKQDPYAWSVGAAAVIRGDIADTIRDVGVCYLKGLLPQFAPPSPSVTVPPPAWSPCARTSRPTRKGEVYTVIIAGTTDQMCQFLSQAVRPTS